jgi:hypothetical protein
VLQLQSSNPLHCSGRVADIGCRTNISAGIVSTIAWTAAMRGSVSNVARSGGGDGIDNSQKLGARKPSTHASSACKCVEPDRG